MTMVRASGISDGEIGYGERVIGDGTVAAHLSICQKRLLA